MLHVESNRLLENHIKAGVSYETSLVRSYPDNIVSCGGGAIGSSASAIVICHVPLATPMDNSGLKYASLL